MLSFLFKIIWSVKDLISAVKIVIWPSAIPLCSSIPPTTCMALSSTWLRYNIKKKSEILQMKLLNPKCILLDEIDSGLDVGSIKLEIMKWKI